MRSDGDQNPNPGSDFSTVSAPLAQCRRRWHSVGAVGTVSAPLAQCPRRWHGVGAVGTASALKERSQAGITGLPGGAQLNAGGTGMPGLGVPLQDGGVAVGPGHRLSLRFLSELPPPRPRLRRTAPRRSRSGIGPPRDAPDPAPGRGPRTSSGPPRRPDSGLPAWRR